MSFSFVECDSCQNTCVLSDLRGGEYKCLHCGSEDVEPLFETAGPARALSEAEELALLDPRGSKTG